MAIRMILFAAALAALAGAVQAQTLTLVPATHPLQSKAPEAAALNAAVAARFGEAGALKGQGVARTSVDRSFDRDRGNGSIGFLCGRPDSLDDRASASPYGSDPHGRFLGAKLSFAFR
jgi:hypothetical protein